ncbi:hypothetical protein B0H17DRAFT_1057258 [Mycena rosella]|uniref:DUF6533 domain-containing protein n=1 Tax=Mycena rosella TaxID=1033263 RepID=A0AAD7DLH9_MYCRO|nr:hypothetical protein B0H17DRAFT_1057258 [Mycena rosella]
MTLTLSPRETPSPSIPTIPLDVVVSDARLANYFAASAFTILFIDFISTIDEEIHFVWKKPWRVPSVLYNRYMTLFTVVLSMPFMFREVKSDHTEGLASTFLFGSFNLLLMLRVWILYGKTRRMAHILFPMLFCKWIDLLHFSRLTDTLSSQVAVPVMVSSNFAFYAIPPLVVTFAMFVMTIHKCLVTLRADKLADMPIITLFLRDGIVWFIVVFFFYGSELIIWASLRATLTHVLVT